MNARISLNIRFGIICILIFSPLYAKQGPQPECVQPNSTPGIYFTKKSYQTEPLPDYESVKQRLPAPIYDEKPAWIKTYWKAWELAFRNFRAPAAGSGFVSQFIDASFNDNVFAWDSSFMTMFTNLGAPLVPGISTLDNFYSRQLPDGEICREIVRATGECLKLWINTDCSPLFSRYGWEESQLENSTGYAPVTYKHRSVPKPAPAYTLDAMNNPILAWAELESYRVTGDRERLKQVWEPLVRYYDSLQKYIRQGNGLYVTDWASMDNSPRNPYLRGGGVGVDISAEMVLFARNLAEISGLLGDSQHLQRFSREADELTELINRRMWDANRQFYFDLTLNEEWSPVKSVAAYWTLLAGVATEGRARHLVDALLDPRTFGRQNAVPTLAADEPLYNPGGGYWRGSVWAPTTTMVLRGLDKYGYHNLARQLALKHLDLVAQVYEKTGTIWENYSPEAIAPGNQAKPDFVGWSGIGPILYLMEYGIGLTPEASRNILHWEIQSATRVGCERYRFNGHLVTLTSESVGANQSRLHIKVESDGDFVLSLQTPSETKQFRVKAGVQEFLASL